MSKVEEKPDAGTAAEQDARRQLEALEIERIAHMAIKDAQEENRRLGIPNYYEIDGRIVSDQD